MDEPPVQRWDRAKWITVFSSHSPTIREITESLGLARAPSSSTTNRGIPKFDAPESRRLSSEVQRLSKDLPKDRDALLDFAADTTNSLNSDLDALLAELGPAIWGRNADRDKLLVAPDETKKTYFKDLFYEDPEDRDVLKIHLHRWIIIKACYYIRNMKLKRPSAADEYDHMAGDIMDVDSPDKSKAPSLNGTPRSGTPVSLESIAPSVVSGNYANLRKRKSEVFTSMSDGEDRASMESAMAKKRLYSSATMPARKSPRKSLASAGFSTENIPPTLSPTSQLQQPPVPVLPSSGPDGPRPLLSPLTNSMLNGAPRPVNPSPPGSFTSANPLPAGGFTAVNSLNTVNPPSAPKPGSYSSPYSTPGVPIAPATQAKSEETHPPLAPNLQRDNSRHSTPTAHIAPNPPPTTSQGHANPAPATVLPRMANIQPAYHNHNIAPAVSATNPPLAQPNHLVPLAPMTHPLLPNGTGVHGGPPVLAAHPPTMPSHLNGHAFDNRGAISSSRLPDLVDTTMIQCELLGSLMRYFFPRDGPTSDESTLLQNLDYVWQANEPSFRRVMGRLFDSQRRVLFAWMMERRSISQLQRQLDSQAGVDAHEMVGRLLAMNDLRVMRLKWKAMKTYDGNVTWSPEDLLCKTLATMTKTEGTEHLFKDGLNKLNENVFTFLKSEDMKISMVKKLE